MEKNFLEIIKKSKKIREKYHELEEKYHWKKWSIEDDILAYLSDSWVLARNFMSEKNIRPKTDSLEEFEHKLAENIWWLIIIADRNNLDISSCLEKFLKKTEEKIWIKL